MFLFHFSRRKGAHSNPSSTMVSCLVCGTETDLVNDIPLSEIKSLSRKAIEALIRGQWKEGIEAATRFLFQSFFIKDFVVEDRWKYLCNNCAIPFLVYFLINSNWKTKFVPELLTKLNHSLSGKSAYFSIVKSLHMTMSIALYVNLLQLKIEIQSRKLSCAALFVRHDMNIQTQQKAFREFHIFYIFELI